MKEQFPSGRSKLFTGARLTLGAAIAAVAVSGCAASSSGNEVQPPNGFSRNKATYDWQIRVYIAYCDVTASCKNSSAILYSNIKPTLSANGGVSLLSGKDVFCPNDSDFRDDAGCTAEFMRNYEIATSRQISVSDNKGIHATPSLATPAR